MSAGPCRILVVVSVQLIACSAAVNGVDAGRTDVVGNGDRTEVADVTDAASGTDAPDAVRPECTTAAECDDGDPCSGDSCAANRCSHVRISPAPAGCNLQVSAGGGHTCALVAGGRVFCWGSNQFGQVGTDFAMRVSMPVAVAGLTGVVEIAAGDEHTCARQTAGNVVCWGKGRDGELGTGTDVVTPIPLAVVGVANTVELAAGGHHACARRAGGDVVCWGVGYGLASATVGVMDAVEIAAGDGGHDCARRAGGTVVCWAGFDAGTGSTTPVEVAGIVGAVEIAGSSFGTCARRADGTVACWQTDGQGRPTTAVTIEGLTDAVGIAVGFAHICARRAGGGVVCWGANDSGQLGDGTMVTRTAPVAVLGLTGAVEITAGGGSDTTVGSGHTCARLGGGEVLCWGDNRVGQLGRDTPIFSTTPLLVPGL